LKWQEGGLVVKSLLVPIGCVLTVGVGRSPSLSQKNGQLVIDEFKPDKDWQVYRSFVKYFRSASSKKQGYVDSHGTITCTDEIIPPSSPSHNGRFIHQNKRPLFDIGQTPPSEVQLVKHSSNISYTCNTITKVPLTIVSRPRTGQDDEKL
jgi:hypothetical protein